MPFCPDLVSKMAKTSKCTFSPCVRRTFLTKMSKMADFDHCWTKMARGGEEDLPTPPTPCPSRFFDPFWWFHANLPGRAMAGCGQPWLAWQGWAETPYMCMTRALLGACLLCSTRVRHPCVRVSVHHHHTPSPTSTSRLARHAIVASG